ncbi:MAG: MYXO-CTERM sorting domain-containing protein [Myxococcaceae bacterium]
MQPFTAVGMATSATNASLTLTHGATYYVAVRATNGVGMTSASVSDGIGIGVPASAPGSSCGATGSAALVWPALVISVGALWRRRRRTFC